MGLSQLGRAGRPNLLVASNLVGAAAGGAVAGAAVHLLARPLPQAVRLAVAALLVAQAARLAVRDRTCGIQRQVPRRWIATMPPWRLMFLWGLLLGAGVVTLVPHSAYLTLLGIQTLVPLPFAVASGAAYGLGRQLAALPVRPPADDLPAAMATLRERAGRMRLVNRFLVAAGAVLVVVVALA